MGETGDRRDDISWVVLELTRAGELRAEEGTLEQALRDTLGVPDHPVFVPATAYVRGGQRVSVQLMEGYAFVASGLPETTYFGLGHDSPLVKKALATTGPGGLPVLSVISNDHVEEMRKKLREAVADDIAIGMRVRVVQGTYCKLDGSVIDMDDTHAQVLIELRSFKMIRSIPRMFLEPIGADDAV